MLKNILKSLTSRKNRTCRPLAKRTLAFENLQNRELMAADMGLVDPALADAPAEVMESEQVDNGLAEAVAEDGQSEKQAERGSIWCEIKGGKLIIKGGTGNDKFDIVKKGDSLLIKDENGKVVSTFKLFQINSIEIHGRGGNDTVTFTGTTGKAIAFYGGNGNDKFTYTGKDSVTAYGGDGVDTLKGGEGDDHLYGGDGNDYLYGGKGADHIEGNDGDDFLYQNNGTNDDDQATDYLYGGDENGSNPNDKHDKAWRSKNDQDYIQDIDHPQPIRSAASAVQDNEVAERVPVQEECVNDDEDDLDHNGSRAHDAYFASLGEEQDEKCDEEDAQEDRPSSVQAASQMSPEVVDLVMGDLSLLV